MAWRFTVILGYVGMADGGYFQSSAEGQDDWPAYSPPAAQGDGRSVLRPYGVCGHGLATEQ